MLGRWVGEVVGRIAENVLSFLWIFISFAVATVMISGFWLAIGRPEAGLLIVLGYVVWVTLGLALFVLGLEVIGKKGRAARRAKRALALNRWARARGWNVDVLEGGHALPARGFPFNLGGEHASLAAVGGRHRGRDAMVVYYAVKTSDGDDPLALDFTIVAVGADADFPVTVAYPQRGAEFLKSFLGFQDFDVESVDFNRRWRVVGTDARASHEILNPRVIERLTASGAKGFPITWDSNAVMAIRHGLSRKWDRIDAQLDLLSDLATHVPRYMARKGGSTIGLSRVSLKGIGTAEGPWFAPSRGAFVLGVLGACLALGSIFLTPLDRPAYPLTCFALGVTLFPVAFWCSWKHKERRRREWVTRANAKV